MAQRLMVKCERLIFAQGPGYIQQNYDKASIIPSAKIVKQKKQLAVDVWKINKCVHILKIMHFLHYYYPLDKIFKEVKSKT